MKRRLIVAGASAIALVAALLLVTNREAPPSAAREEHGAKAPPAGIAEDPRPSRRIIDAADDASADPAPLATGACDDDHNPLANLDAERMKLAVGSAPRVLAASDSAEHLLAAAVLSTAFDADNLADVDALAAARTMAHDHPLLPVVWLSICARAGDSAACSGGRDERYATQQASHNGAIWARLAARRLQRGDIEAGFDALGQAVAAPSFDSQLAELLTLFERALAASTDLGYVDRVAFALGLSASILPLATEVVIACRKEDMQPRYGQVCLAYAERLETDGAALLEKLIGVELQIALHEASGSAAPLAEASRRKDDLRALATGDLSGGMERFMWQDEQVLAGWLDEMLISGEVEARRRVRAEYERRVEQGLVVDCVR